MFRSLPLLAITRAMSKQTPRIISATELSASDAKWITLKKINWTDEDGKDRMWECAERKTRGSGGIDAVAVFTILRSENKSFPPSTVVIEQYRPPVASVVIEFPAGLIDEGETPEQAAIRELEEETGYKADRVLESSNVMVSDPGLSSANMKLVVLGVTVSEKMQLEPPKANLQPGEHIVPRVIELSKLRAELDAYNQKGFSVDARLAHIAMGWDFATRMGTGDF